MIDPARETLLTIKQARSLFPNHPSLPTLWRWMLKGVRGCKLDSIRIGGRRFTSQEACQRFMTDSRDAGASNAKVREKREQSLSLARLALDQLGI